VRGGCWGLKQQLQLLLVGLVVGSSGVYKQLVQEKGHHCCRRDELIQTQDRAVSGKEQ
jgi:hypothetical protein